MWKGGGMLIDLRDYISKRGVCSLAEISHHFKTSPDAMRGMLAHWVRKGKLSVEPLSCKSGCVSCEPELLELYRWHEAINKINICNLI